MKLLFVFKKETVGFYWKKGMEPSPFDMLRNRRHLNCLPPEGLEGAP